MVELPIFWPSTTTEIQMSTFGQRTISMNFWQLQRIVRNVESWKRWKMIDLPEALQMNHENTITVQQSIKLVANLLVDKHRRKIDA